MTQLRDSLSSKGPYIIVQYAQIMILMVGITENYFLLLILLHREAAAAPREVKLTEGPLFREPSSDCDRRVLPVRVLKWFEVEGRSVIFCHSCIRVCIGEIIVLRVCFSEI